MKYKFSKDYKRLKLLLDDGLVIRLYRGIAIKKGKKVYILGNEKTIHYYFEKDCEKLNIAFIDPEYTNNTIEL